MLGYQVFDEIAYSKRNKEGLGIEAEECEILCDKFGHLKVKQNKGITRSTANPVLQSKARSYRGPPRW